MNTKFFYRTNVRRPKTPTLTNDTTATKGVKATNASTPARKTPRKKRERPNVFMTSDHYEGHEIVLKNTDKSPEIKEFRMMFNKEKSRGVTFMNNKFIGLRGEEVSYPTIFLTNFWKEKPELIKNPDVSNFNLYSFKNCNIWEFYQSNILRRISPTALISS